MVLARLLVSVEEISRVAPTTQGPRGALVGPPGYHSLVVCTCAATRGTMQMDPAGFQVRTIGPFLKDIIFIKDGWD